MNNQYPQHIKWVINGMLYLKFTKASHIMNKTHILYKQPTFMIIGNISILKYIIKDIMENGGILVLSSGMDFGY